ncbi:hypothetical protein KPL71_024065 [Citrus sinensis]|uniref:Uncharacterized protein n=1 Tax=Citrus sinensis TaxID=2711 RepID=A0ACB8IN05_CITSI|nr:hypothetical protein KPL71_024065 [Citrus sinensis]
MISTKIDLEKFTGKNDFNMWKVKMEALLITQGLGDALEPVTKKEGKEESSSKTPKMAAEIDKKARSTIILILGDLVIREVAKEKTVADLWAKLEKIYMTKSLANRLYIKRRMFTLKMAEGSSLDDHIDEFNQLCDTLETIDEGLDDEEKALLLVSSLPQSYSNLVDALMYGRSTLSLDEVKAALNTRGLQEKSGNMMHAEGLSVKGKFNKNDGKKKKQKQEKSKSQNKKCFHCNKEGHFKRDCQELKNKNKERNGDATTVEEEGYESAGVCVATEDLQRGKWILDSGCTFHMCPFKTYFSDYHDLDGGKVMMGNNAVCKVIGMGNVSLRLHDGTIWELREVRYVPNLKRNLISRGITDVIVGTGGESTRLWHLRLGHMSIKGLKELEKQGVLGKDKIEELDFCEDCVFGKSTRHSFKHSTSKSIGIIDYIHSDLWGPAQTSSLGERMNRTLMDKVRCMLVQAKLPKGLWAETLLTASYLVNLSPSAALDFKTPFEIWHGKPASYVNLKVFGCPAYAHVNQGKLAPRALKDVAFNEKAVLEVRKEAGLKTQKPQVQDNIQLEVEQPDSKKSERAESLDQDSEDHDECSDPQPQSQRQTQVQGYQLTKDRENRQIRPPLRYGYADLIAYALAASNDIDVDEPKSYAEAIQSSNKIEWQEAMNEEIASLKKNHTWILVEKAGNRRTVGCKWVFRVKEGLTASEPSRYKARLVAKGYTQREGVDFKEVFSPVVRHASIRVLLAMTAVHDLELDQLDVKTAFLHGRLQEEILMTQPEGYVDSEKPNHVCLLKRSLYGLKQSPRQWYLRFDEFMLSHGYLRCSFDCCVYYKQISPNLYIYLLLYVDDMLVACKSREEITVLKNLLSSEFEMKDLGPAKKILGMEIKRDRSKGIMFLSQKKYLRRVLETFGMTSCKPVMTPIAIHFKLSSLQCPKTKEEKLEMTKIPYANAVGCMMYAMVLTRPDISYALSVVSRYMVSPGKEHWRAVKWVLRYLSGTLNQGLVYGKSGIKSEGISGFVDSDFAGDLDRRRSLIGYLYMLDGCLINWKASLQHVVALSTTEAEYTAAAEAVKEAL